MSDSQMPGTKTQTLALFAGHKPDGSVVMEEMTCTVIDKNRFKAHHSPAFVSGLARDDEFALDHQKPGYFNVLQRSGQICVTVISQSGTTEIHKALAEPIAAASGVFDQITDRMLVCSLPIEMGFAAIEQLFDQVSQSFQGRWAYGNVYDLLTGEPLNWWQNA